MATLYQDEMRTFTLDDADAHAVWLLGDFNHWSTTSHPLERVGPHRWQTRVRLAAEDGHGGRYCFFVWRSERGPGVIVSATPSRRGTGARMYDPASARPAAFDAGPTTAAAV